MRGQTWESSILTTKDWRLAYCGVYRSRSHKKRFGRLLLAAKDALAEILLAAKDALAETLKQVVSLQLALLTIGKDEQSSESGAALLSRGNAVKQQKRFKDGCSVRRVLWYDTCAFRRTLSTILKFEDIRF